MILNDTTDSQLTAKHTLSYFEKLQSMLFIFRLSKLILKTHSEKENLTFFTRKWLYYQNKSLKNNSSQQQQRWEVPFVHRIETVQQVSVGRFGRRWKRPHIFLFSSFYSGSLGQPLLLLI